MADDIPALIAALDGKTYGEVEDARERLVPLGPAILPHVADGFPRLRTWRGRLALVHTTMKFARRFDVAVELALTALLDKSVRVRSVACAMLAFSLRPEVMPALRVLLDDPDPLVAADAAAAIDAIAHGNHNLCRDRDHSGRVMWHIGGSEDYL